MSRVGQIWRRTFKFISMMGNTFQVMSSVLGILAFLGLSAAAYGLNIHVLPLLLIGISIVTVSIILFISFYTLLEENMKTKAISSNEHANTAILPSTATAEKLSAKTHPTDTIEYPPPLPQDVEILRKEIVYEYLADGKTIYQRKYLEIKALSNGLPNFKDRYRWTGRGQCTVSSLTPGFRITDQHKVVEQIWDYFNVTFPYPLQAGEVIEFALEWKLFDEEKIAVTFLSATIDRETKYLLLQVNLPPEMAPKRAYFHDFANYIDTLPARTQPIQWSPATKSITYEVNKPQKYHKYLIRWYS
ncbi:MAG TPA: hypothetical protein VKP04_00505 [Ktedonobacteraceae bacterium]|nr:hypothetical protein [Ktedonobacteraceae bacterium]